MRTKKLVWRTTSLTDIPFSLWIIIAYAGFWIWLPIHSYINDSSNTATEVANTLPPSITAENPATGQPPFSVDQCDQWLREAAEKYCATCGPHVRPQ